MNVLWDMGLLLYSVRITGHFTALPTEVDRPAYDRQALQNIDKIQLKDDQTTAFNDFTTNMPWFTTKICKLYISFNVLNPTIMEANTKKHPVLNVLLSVLNVGLEIILALIALGFLVGIWSYLS